MHARIPSRLLMAATLATTLAACEQSTGPEDQATFDAEAVLGDYRALDSILSSPSMAGFRAMASGITFQSLGPEAELIQASLEELYGPDAAGPGALTTREGAEAWAGGVGKLAYALGPDVARSPLISALRRGRTFVYDPGLGRYVIDPAREGAPATGVRFILYAPAGGHPDVGQEVGHADLIDEGDGSPQDIALRLVVVDGDRTILEYRTTIDVVAQGGMITVDGFIQGPYDRLTFDLGVRGTAGAEGSQVDVSFDLGMENRDYRAAGSIQGMNGSTGEGGKVHLQASHGRDSFSVDLTGTDTTIGGTVKVNGDLFATVSGHPDNPTVTSADGDPLNGLEFLVLVGIVDTSGKVFHLFGDLMNPIDELVLLALIL